MPVDSRRITGPEDTTNPSLYSKKAQNLKPLLNTENQRSDGREINKIRPLFLKCSLVSQARGSSYIELDKTKVICAVYGPRQVARQEDFSMKGQIRCEFKFATFSCQRRRHHQQDNEEKDYCIVLQQALEPAVCLDKFPKSQIDVFVTVLENDGSALAAAITAASVAVADAGIDMYDMVIGCSSRCYGDYLLMDPSEHEEYKSEDSSSYPSGSITVGLMPNLHQVAALTQRGAVSCWITSEAVQKCVEYCQRIYPVIQQCLINSVKHKIHKEF